MRNEFVTVFGGSGFIGRSVVKRLADRGARIRVITRNPQTALHLKSLGEVGQVSVARLSNLELEAIQSGCGPADHVINLIGILYESRSGDFDEIHGELAGRIAQAAKAVGAKSMVQLSAIGADRGSKSSYARSKASGEAAVLNAFPAAAILRPSIVFGPGDGFFERFGDMAARSPFLPLIDGGKTRFQPVYVGDVAEAVLVCLGGRRGVFELGGPNVYSFKELLGYLLAILGRNRILLPLPSSLLRLAASVVEKLPNPQITRDQLILLEYDNIVAKDAATLADLGIVAKPVEAIVPTYMNGYASDGRANFA